MMLMQISLLLCTFLALTFGAEINEDFSAEIKFKSRYLEDRPAYLKDAVFIGRSLQDSEDGIISSGKCDGDEISVCLSDFYGSILDNLDIDLNDGTAKYDDCNRVYWDIQALLLCADLACDAWDKTFCNELIDILTNETSTDSSGEPQTFLLNCRNAANALLCTVTEFTAAVIGILYLVSAIIILGSICCGVGEINTLQFAVLAWASSVLFPIFGTIIFITLYECKCCPGRCYGNGYEDEFTYYADKYDSDASTLENKPGVTPSI